MVCLNFCRLQALEVQAYLPESQIPLPAKDLVTLAVFHPGGNSNELLRWIEELSLREQEVKGILFVSIVWPGRRIQLLPPGKRLQALRDETESAIHGYERNAEELSLFRAMRIAYVGDWEKRIYRHFGLKTENTSLILFDAEGNEAGRWERFSKASALSLRTAFLKLRQTQSVEDPMDFSGFAAP